MIIHSLETRALQETWAVRGRSLRTLPSYLAENNNVVKVNIMLAPLDIRGVQEKKIKFFMKHANFEVVEKSIPFMFALVVEFMDILLEEVPYRLPLMKYIQQYIDFILWSSIPNKSAYRINTKEY
uniref:Uncharacterized protein n=1 Tax=Lactuca sativa TaxID=4236 RepID=A0A9R1V6B0_LACSA|nr:hypothetical protein LSAT_V11C600329570 [Lactuca sativa]